MINLARIALVAIGLSSMAAGYGQTLSVKDAPPPITFAEWQPTGATEDASEFRETFPSAAKSDYPVNDIVPLRIFIPSKAVGPLPAVVVLHYWGATDLKVERALCRSFAKRGIASAIMTLPYHLERSPAGHRSGSLAVQADPAKLVAMMTQAVLDVRRTLDFLQSRPEFDRNRIGIAGTSLGALVGALAYGVDPRLSCATFMLGGVDLAHIIWNSTRAVKERDQMRQDGYTEERLREALEPVEPGAYLKARGPGSAFVIGARFDTVIPNESTEGLIRDLPGAKTLWLDTGHYGGIFVQGRLLSEVAKFFQGQFDSHPYTPPASVWAPTIRLGAEFSSGTGFDIDLGLDIIKPRGIRSPFASILVAPRGPRIFVGQGVDRGIALGVVIKTDHPGIGILWSTVL